MKATSFQPMCGTFSAAGLERDDLAGQQPEPAIAAELGRARRRAAACPGTGRAPASPPPRARRTSSSRPSSRMARIAAAKAPTPGTTRPSAARSASWSAVSATRAPTRSSAFSTLRRLPIPWSTMPDRWSRVSVPFVDGTPGLGRVDRDRDAQRAGEGLEGRLDHVVGVGAGLDVDVDASCARRWPRRGRTPRSARGRSRRCRPAAGRRRSGSTGARRCRSRTMRAPRPSAPWRAP